MKLSIKGVRMKQCKKPGCTRLPVQRHHKGSEHAWVVYFQHKHLQARYREWVRRYYEFRDEDCVDICAHHHEEIHHRYGRIFSKYCRRFDKKLKDFSWTEAEQLTEALRAYCDRWLLRETRGMEPGRFIMQYPHLKK